MFNGDSPLSWGWGNVEEVVGPLVPGRVYVVGARPSNGKTALLMNLLARMWRGMLEEERPLMSVFCAWTERSRFAAIKSMAALLTGYDEDLVLQDAWHQLPERAENVVCQEALRLHDGDGWLCTFYDHSLPTVRELSTAMKACLVPPRLVFLDYLQMIRPERGETSFDAWMGAMRWASELASGGVTVFVGSQLKRRGDGVFDKYRPPYLEDFKGGGTIEEQADVALGLFRPLKRMQASDERDLRAGMVDLERWKEPNIMAVKVLKHRYRSTAADQLIRLYVGAERWITDYHSNGQPTRDRDPIPF